MKKSRLSCTLLAALLLMTGCGAENTSTGTIIELQASALSEDQTVVVERGDMEITVAMDAQVGPKVIQLTFPKDGQFGEFRVGIGEEVKEGDILATSYMGDSDEQIEAKEKELENLIANYNYQKATMENSIAIIDIYMDKLNEQLENTAYMSAQYTAICTQLGNYDVQRKKLELQLEHLTETYELQRPHVESQIKDLKAESSGNVIKAPFDGVVVALADVSVGTYLEEQMYYVAVADPDILYARCPYVSQSTINSIEDVVFWKDGVEYEVSYVPMEEHTYRVMRNNNEDIYSEFALENAGDAVVHGDYGKVILIAGCKEDVLKVPEVAVGSDSGKAYVYKDVDGQRVRVEVEIGSKDGLYVEITEGLQEGDVLYVQE